jgi:hypothetical protein
MGEKLTYHKVDKKHSLHFLRTRVPHLLVYKIIMSHFAGVGLKSTKYQEANKLNVVQDYLDK